jgi:hypothetical protein
VEILYTLNLIIAISLILAPLWWSHRLLDLPWLNPVSLAAICFLPVDLFRLLVGQLFRDDGLMAPSYQFAVLMTNIQQSIALGILVFAAQLQVTRRLPYLLPRLGVYQPKDLRRFSRVFFLLFLAAFLILAINTGGVTDWLMDIRGSYIRKREGNGIFYAAAVSFISISYFFEGVASTRSLAFSLRSLAFFSAIYVLGSKGFVLQFFVFYLVIVLRQQRVNVARVLMVALPLAFSLLLINFFSQHDLVEAASVAEYFDYYPNAAMFYEDYFRGAVKLFDGKVILSSLWEYVPRSMASDKPYVYGILHVVEIYYPGGAESGNTPAFQGGVPQFADFGFPGVIVFALLNWTPLIYFAGLRYTLKDRAFLKQGPISGRAILLSMLLFAPAFGVFLPTGLLAMLLVFVICLIKFIKITTRLFASTS